MKVVINRCYGDFQIRREVADEIGWESTFENENLRKDRADPKLISVLERMIKNGQDINPTGTGTKLKIVEIPDNTNWAILDYYGSEIIVDIDRMWY